MSVSTSGTATTMANVSMTRGMVLLFAFCCGAIVANIYYAQPIISLIAPDIGMSNGSASFIATIVVTIFSLIAAGLARQPSVFLVVSALIGFSSVSVQMLIPLAAHLAPEESRGRVVGGIMGGLLLGILLARPLSSLVADHFGWRAVFIGAAALMLVISVVIGMTMPKWQPAHRASYGQLLKSLGQLFYREPVLRQRALYQGLMFAAFSLFWTAVPMVLSREFGLSQSQIAIFSLVGAIGAVAAPISGRLADAGHTRRASQLAMILAAVSFLPAFINPFYGVIGLAVTGIALDFAVQMNMVLGQRAVYALGTANRGRLNALYMISIFIGGAFGSSVASSLYEHFSWLAIAAVGSALSLVTLIVFLVVSRRDAQSH